MTEVRNSKITLCSICGSLFPDESKSHKPASIFRRCTACGHDSRIQPLNDSVADNEILNMKSVSKIDALTAYKLRYIKNRRANSEVLIDVGSSSGKLIFHAQQWFKECFGIEVSESALKFSTEVLGLKVFRQLSEIPKIQRRTFACFWHSLEHMSIDQARSALSELKARMAPDSLVIIAVPNSLSWQYRIFGSAWTYYDTDSHLHQFSVCSLDKLLESAGLQRTSLDVSAIYSIFGYLQSAVNLVISPHNYLYYWLKRGDTRQVGPIRALILSGLSLCLVALLLIPACLAYLLDLVKKDKAGVIVVSYRAASS